MDFKENHRVRVMLGVRVRQLLKTQLFAIRITYIFSHLKLKVQLSGAVGEFVDTCYVPFGII